MELKEFNNLKDREQYFLLKCIKYAKKSTALKRKVGAVLGSYTLLSYGYNHNGNNKCEDSFGETYPEVIHAEAQAIFNYFKNFSSINSNVRQSPITLYCTYSPCMECCKQIVLSNIIDKIIFIEKHPINFDAVDNSPIDFLKKHNIEIIQVTNVPSKKAIKNEQY